MDSKPKDEGQLVSDGRYQIPKFNSLFAYCNNPIGKENILMNRWMDWICQFSLLSKDHFDKRIRDTGVMTVTYMYPFCKDVNRFERLVKFITCMYIYDDYFDLCNDKEAIHIMIEQTINCITRLEAVYVKGEHHKISILSFKPFVICAYLIVEEILIDSNMEQRKRFLNLFHSYCLASIKENAVVEKQILDLDEINKVRIESGAMKMVFALIQYSEKIHVPDEVWENQRIQRLMDLCSLNAVYVNDVYSFEKEYVEEDMSKIFVNIVGFHLLKYKYSIEVSIEKSLDVIRDYERQYKVLSDSLLNDHSVDAEIKKFIECLTAVYAGVFGYSMRCKRYNNIYGGQAKNQFV